MNNNDKLRIKAEIDFKKIEQNIIQLNSKLEKHSLAIDNINEISINTRTFIFEKFFEYVIKFVSSFHKPFINYT